MRVITAVAAVLLLMACTPQGRPPGSAQPAADATIEERAFSVAGVAGYEQPWIEFATRDRGYAMFTSCGPDGCKAMLFSTSDGARTWKAHAHPQPMAKNQQMYVAAADVVVLLADPDAWYVSRDGAKSWQRTAYVESVLPPEYPIGDGGRFYVDDNGTLRDRQEPGTRRPVPEGASTLANGSGTVLWLAGHVGGQPVTWVGRSGPDSWEPVPVPRQGSRTVMAARVAISADGDDTWLIADPEPLAAGGGGTARARGSILKPTGVPLIWRLSDSSWVPVPTAGIEEKPAWSYSTTPAGGGLLLMSSPEGVVHLRERVVRTVSRPVLQWIGHLHDGTIVGRGSHDDAIYLSSATDPATSWTKVVLSP